jgi:hypothetical protein
MKAPNPTEYQGAALASLALNVAILGKMKANGVLSSQEITEMVDVSVLVLEQLGLKDESLRAAHGLLQCILSLLGDQQPPDK